MPSIDILPTARLMAKCLGEEHFEELLKMHRDEKVMATLGGVRLDEAWTHEFLQKTIAHWNRYGFGLWAFRDQANGKFAGRGGLRHIIVGGQEEVELAYALMSDHLICHTSSIGRQRKAGRIGQHKVRLPIHRFLSPTEDHDITGSN